MTKRELFNNYKKQQKELASKIRSNKVERKICGKNFSKLRKIEFEIYCDKRDYRHMALCTMRGTPYEKIERACKIEPNFSYIEGIKKNILKEIEGIEANA